MKQLDIDYKQLNGLVSKIARDISCSRWQPDYIVGITRGGLLPAVMLSHYFDIPCQTLKVSLRDGSDADCESNLWMAEEAYGYAAMTDRNHLNEPMDVERRKNILIVDDINDSGATINWIMDDWQRSCMPKDVDTWQQVWNNNVKFAVLIDNLSSKCRVRTDYYGMEINKAKDPVWVNFPYEVWFQR